jgi:hypothetical protein
MRGILVVFYISPGSFGKDSALMEPPQKVLMRSSGLVLGFSSLAGPRYNIVSILW